MLARRCVCWTDGVFGFAIARRIDWWFISGFGKVSAPLIPLRLGQERSRDHPALRQLKPDVVVNRQVKCQETLPRDSSRLRCLSDLVLHTSSLPFWTPVIPLWLFSLCHGQQQMFWVRDLAECFPSMSGPGGEGLYLWDIFVSFSFCSWMYFLYIVSCWKPSIGDITAIKLQKKKKEDNL